MVFGIYQLAKGSAQIWKYTPWEWGEDLSILILVVGIITLLIGIFGTWGAVKRNKCCLCLY